MQLTESNYYSVEADKEYCSNSQLKLFQKCQYHAMKELSKTQEERDAEPKSDALLVGSLLDELVTGTKESLDKFIEENKKEIYKYGNPEKGYKAEFSKVDAMFEKLTSDKKAWWYLSGQHQKIFEGTLFGVPFKCKLDSYIPDKAIVDLKTCQSITKAFWDSEKRQYVSFIEFFGYDLQMAIYQQIVYQNTGKLLPCYIVAVSKETIPDIELITFDNETLHDIIYGDGVMTFGLADELEQIRLLKAGEIEPIKCGRCELCRSEKKIDKPIHFKELAGRLD